VEKDSINGLKMIRYSAMIAAWVGNKDLACEQLAISLSGRPQPRQFETAHALGSTASDPRSEQIVASLAPKL
jgi:hypothetical protein